MAFCCSASLLKMAKERSELLRFMGAALGYLARLSMVMGLPFERFNLIMTKAFQFSSGENNECG